MRRDMMQLLEWRNGANVLYVSIGTGKDFNYIPANVDAKSLQLVGADISLGMLRRAQKVWSRKLELSLVHCAAEDLPFADNYFDIVFHVGGINFFSDKARAIAEMLRVAKPGTRLMIADETQDFIESQYQKNALTKKAYADAQFDLAEIENAIPDSTRERQTHFLWDNRFYAMTIQKGIAFTKKRAVTDSALGGCLQFESPLPAERALLSGKKFPPTIKVADSCSPG